MAPLIIVKEITELVLNQHKDTFFTNILQGNTVKNVVYTSQTDVITQTAETLLKDQSV